MGHTSIENDIATELRGLGASRGDFEDQPAVQKRRDVEASLPGCRQNELLLLPKV
jgi:hypothetical protein